MGRTPREIRELGTEAVRLYNAAIDQGHYVNDLIRCMFVGHHGVGKTTLVKTFLADKDKRKTAQYRWHRCTHQKNVILIRIQMTGTSKVSKMYSV